MPQRSDKAVVIFGGFMYNDTKAQKTCARGSGVFAPRHPLYTEKRPPYTTAYAAARNYHYTVLPR